MLPKILQYNNIKPKGFASSVKQWKVYPTSQFPQFQKNEQVRFQFQTDNFIEPYHSYIEIEIEMLTDYYDYGENTQTAPALLLDGASTSLISEMILYSNNKEIERIQEYDQLGQILNDFQVLPNNKSSKIYEGMKFAQNYNDCNLPANNIGYFNLNPTDLKLIANVDDKKKIEYLQWTLQNPFLGGYDTSTQESINNIWAVTNPSPDVMIQKLQTNQSFLQQAWFTKNVTTFATSEMDLTLFRDRFKRNQKLLNSFAIKELYNAQLGVEHTHSIHHPLAETYNSDGSSQLNDHGLLARYNGYKKPFNSVTSNTQDDYIFPWMRRTTIRDGMFLKQLPKPPVDNLNTNMSTFYDINSRNSGIQRAGLLQKFSAFKVNNQNFKTYTTSKRIFKVPLLSGVLGKLIPRSQYRLIPGKGLGSLMFEFRLNPHAFYLSNVRNAINSGPGLNIGLTTMSDEMMDSDIANLSNILQYDRAWKVSNIFLNFELWTFDQYVHQQIDQMLSGEGIILSSQSFTLGPTYNVPTNGNISNTWHISNGIPSLKNLYVWFLDNAYLKRSYCRKHFRLSLNVTEIQLKLGELLVPQQSVKGRSGNPINFDDGSEDCTPFIEQIHKSINCWFNYDMHLNINHANFAMSERPYNPDILADVIYGQSAFHEQRQVGKAIFTIDTESDPYDFTVLSGLNMKDKRPTELLIKNDYKPNLGTDILECSMFIMMHHDFLVQFTNEGVITSGNS